MTKDTGVIFIRILGGPLDGAELRSNDIGFASSHILVTRPASEQWNHQTCYQLQCFQQPDGTMDYAYVATRVTAVERAK